MLKLRELPECDDLTFRRAMRDAIGQQASEVAAPSVGPRSLSGRLPSLAKLEQGAAELASESSEDAEAARYFCSLLEISYLVATADGLADGERSALAALIELTTNSVIGASELAALFMRFDENLERDGLDARLDAVAGNFDDFMAREEAMSFTALVAIADRKLTEPEAEALASLGSKLDFSVGEVQAMLDQVVVGTTLAIKRAG